MNIDKYPIAYVGSAKNLRPVKKFTDDKMGETIFEFTNDISVKDYGKLPFTTPYKGADLCAMAVRGFEDIEALGISTIFKEQVADNAILVDYVRVINPDDVDLSAVKKNRLVPIEVIIRNLVTETSSAKRRLDKGTLHYGSLGLSKMPTKFPVVLPKMYCDGSTKLRAADEYLPWDQLKEMAHESIELINELELKTKLIGLYALEKGAAAGLIINDFKLEWALDDQGKLVLADVPLAPDEITCAYVGRSFESLDEFKDIRIFIPGKLHDMDAFVNSSKQMYRDHYSAAEPQWVEELEKAKAEGLPKSEFPVPNKAPDDLIQYCSDMFGGLRNLWCPDDKRDVGPLAENALAYKKWASGFYELV